MHNYLKMWKTIWVDALFLLKGKMKTREREKKKLRLSIGTHLMWSEIIKRFIDFVRSTESLWKWVFEIWNLVWILHSSNLWCIQHQQIQCEFWGIRLRRFFFKLDELCSTFHSDTKCEMQAKMEICKFPMSLSLWLSKSSNISIFRSLYHAKIAERRMFDMYIKNEIEYYRWRR